MNARLSDLERRVANLIQPGTVEETDYPNARVRVKIGLNVTAWLPWMTTRAGGDRSWHAPEVGEQVLVLSPSGDFRQGFALPSIYQNAHPAPADSEKIHRIEYSDGAVLEYDRENHRLTATIPGEVVIDAQGDIKATTQKSATVEATENISATAQGNISASSAGTITANCAGAMSLQASGAVLIQAGGILTLQAPSLVIDGPVTQTGGDITSDGISAQTHTHSGVTSGTETSGPPVATP
jgi:phage baseplate assembly protein V